MKLFIMYFFNRLKMLEYIWNKSEQILMDITQSIATGISCKKKCYLLFSKIILWITTHWPVIVSIWYKFEPKETKLETVVLHCDNDWHIIIIMVKFFAMPMKRLFSSSVKDCYKIFCCRLLFTSSSKSKQYTLTLFQKLMSIDPSLRNLKELG